MKNKIYIVILLTSFGYSLSMFNVTPLRFNFEVEKGKSGQDILYVKNPTDNDTLDLTVSIHDFIYDHGKEVVSEKGGHDRTCASWITISPKSSKPVF